MSLLHIMTSYPTGWQNQEFNMLTSSLILSREHMDHIYLQRLKSDRRSLDLSPTKKIKKDSRSSSPALSTGSGGRRISSSPSTQNLRRESAGVPTVRKEAIGFVETAAAIKRNQ